MFVFDKTRKPGLNNQNHDNLRKIIGLNNQSHENARKIIGVNSEPKTKVLNKNNSTNNTSKNPSALGKRIGIPKSLDNPYPPAYARPTLATAARGMNVAKKLMQKSIASTNNKNAKEQKSNSAARPKTQQQQLVERLAGGELAMDYNSARHDITMKHKLNDKLDSVVHMDTQTNEEEIRNHEIIVGDVKLLLPSPHVVAAIEQERKEQRRLEQLHSMRKMDAHTEKQAMHLSDLKEFLETATVTRRNRKPVPVYAKPVNKTKPDAKKVMMQQQLIKADSVLSIKSRIKQKERELLSLFDRVEKM